MLTKSVTIPITCMYFKLKVGNGLLVCSWFEQCVIFFSTISKFSWCWAKFQSRLLKLQLHLILHHSPPHSKWLNFYTCNYNNVDANIVWSSGVSWCNLNIHHWSILSEDCLNAVATERDSENKVVSRVWEEVAIRRSFSIGKWSVKIFLIVT